MRPHEPSSSQPTDQGTLLGSPLGFVGGGICLLLAQLAVRPPYSHWGPDYYWATYWVANYSEGICRRCALGTARSGVGDDSTAWM